MEMTTDSTAVKSEKMPVRLKGIGDSLWVTLDPSHPHDYLKKQAGKLFERLKDLTINARVILDPGEEDGHEALVAEMEKYLKDTFHVGKVSRPPKPKLNTASDPSSLQRRKEDFPSDEEQADLMTETSCSDTLVVAGRVRSGQKVYAKNHLTVLGDVNPGAEVSAGGDIIIMGSLRGTALAGMPDNEDAIIVALDFRPTQVQIGGYVAAGLPPLKEKQVEYAKIKDGSIVVENYTKNNPFGALHFPQIRE